MALGRYGAVGERLAPGEVAKGGRTPLGDSETVNSTERSRYVLVGSPVKTANFALSKFGSEDPVNVVRCHSIRDLEEAATNERWQGAAIILVPGWAQHGLANDVVSFVLAGIDGVGA